MANLRVTGTFIKHLDMKTIGNDYHVLEFVIDDSQNPAYPNTPVFIVDGSTDPANTRLNMKLIDLVKSLKKGETVIIDFRIKAKPSERYEKPFVSLQAWQILRMQSNITNSVEQD